MPHNGLWKEILNSDAAIYGGAGNGNGGQVEATGGVAAMTLPPLATVMFEYQAQA